MRYHPQILSLSAALLMAVPAAAQKSEPVFINPDFEELSLRWQGAMESLRVPGFAVAVVEGDTILHLETFGIRDSESGAPVNPDTMFYIASATKPYVSLALLQCVDEGLLDLDKPIKGYLPRFELADKEATKSITARDLLCHRPGINSGPIVYLDAYSGGITDDRYFHFLSKVQPTGIVNYTNVHLTLAGHLLQAIDGKPWKQSLKTRIFDPLGMQHTTGYATWMYAQENVAFPTALSKDGGFEHASIRKTDETMHAAGGLGTSISDAAHWLQLNLGLGFLNGEQLVSEVQMEDMFSLQSEWDQIPGIDGFGLGWMRGELHGEVLMQHGGGYVGSSADFSFMPSTGLGVVVLTNNDLGGRAMVDIVKGDVYAHMVAAQPGWDHLPAAVRKVQRSLDRMADDEPSTRNPAQEEGGLSLLAERYVGLFRDTHWGDLEIGLDEGQLVGRMGNVRLVLEKIAEDHFAVEGSDGRQWELKVRVQNGQVVGMDSELWDQPIHFERVKG